MNREDMEWLSPVERVAGYLSVLMRHAAVGAKLRKDGREDSSWSPEEEAEFYECIDELDDWWRALTEEECKAIEPIERYISSIGRGEWPLEV